MNIQTAAREFGNVSYGTEIKYNDLGILRVDDLGSCARLVVSGDSYGMTAGDIKSQLESLPTYYDVEIMYNGDGRSLRRVASNGNIS